MTSELRVWVLGSVNPNADRCIQWDSPFPNLADADVLIVNMQSLGQEVLKRNKDKLEKAAVEILEKSINGSELIFITAPKSSETNIDIPSNYVLSPVEFETQSVSPGTNIKFVASHRFGQYYSEVKSYNFYLYAPRLSKYSSYLRPSSPKMKLIIDLIENTSRPGLVGVEESDPLSITDNSDRMLSGTFNIFYHDTTRVVDRKYVKRNGAIITYLPPVAGNSSIEEGIDIILDALGKSTSREAFPEWTSNIRLKGIEDLNLKISKNQDKLHNLEFKIQELQHEKQNLLLHYRLLVSKGHPLVMGVADAFKFLGFNEINNPRGNEFEDLRFEFKTIPDYKYAVFEIHGTENMTNLNKLRQCNHYVEDYYDSIDGNVKGIFIANQHRLKPYPENQQERLYFEPRHIQYSQKQNICIIPSSVLFESVIRTLESKRKPRKLLEKMIVNCKGVLKEF